MRRKRGRHSLRIFILGFGAASFATCSRAARDPLGKTVLALHQGIDALTDPAADFRAILQGLSTDLPGRAEASVGAAISRLLDRLPPAEADFQCGADFVRLRVRKELIRLEERLLGTTPEPAAPQFCYAAPFAVDLTRAPSTVEIYGFDFDLVPLQVVLVTSEGYSDVSAALIPRTHYHVTVALGEQGVGLPANAQSLGLAWGNLIHHAIPMVGARTTLCSCTIEEIPPGRTIEYTPSLVPQRRQPATPTTGWANALMDYEGNELNTSLCMAVSDSSGDRALRSGCVRAFILTVASDRTIEWLFGRTEGRSTYPPPSNGEGSTDFPNDGELLRRWRFAGFSTDSVGPRVNVELGSIRLVSTGGEGCISPIAYLEARRNGAMGPATVRALDRQLAKVGREILNLRPRFAPVIREGRGPIQAPSDH